MNASNLELRQQQSFVQAKHKSACQPVVAHQAVNLGNGTLSAVLAAARNFAHDCLQLNLQGSSSSSSKRTW
jgi:hypothetical protein